MIQPLFCLGLVIVMLAQGMALQPRDIGDWAGARRDMLFFLALRIVLLPAMALILGRALMRGLEIAPLTGSGLVMAFTAPPAVAGLALAAVSGGSAAVFARLAAVGTVISLIIAPVLLAPLVMQAPFEAAVLLVLLLAGLPFSIGMMLRQWAAQFGRMPATIASVVTGAMMLATFVLGWDGDAPVTILAVAIMLVVALAMTIAGAQLLRLPPGSAQAVTLSTLIPVTAMPMALAGGHFPIGLAAASYGVMGYLVALALIVLRLRRRA
ncbi:hypothetical protein FNJ84_07495 [Paracoccus sp. M683]|uniref:hypothetical protein n=1 Tax=Paracoccus sp. M683 TaxID=2594268 RepID=UPI00117FFC32|nr:hypothetical protein [Paracoccus sp. M683]TRW97355.1 hypothetical protein FNJ84_07495 [Paracoccus sp. M683]